MWTGRFQEPTHNLLRRYSESVSFDRRLWRHDLLGSRAHAAALRAAGFLTAAEERAINRGMDEITTDIEAGRFEWREDLEDVHMNLEAELTRRIGAPGAKLHTARSRNDQVALDLRLWLRDECAAVQDAVRGLQAALVGLAGRHPGAVMPGYTHLQRAQPVLFAHHLLAYVEMLERDHDRLGECSRRLDVMPLGSGAIAGSTLVLDRRLVAKRLGFARVSANSMDAVSDRDFACDFLYAAAMIGMHLSRLSEDVILWATSEFGFLKLSDAFTTGSSLMPQKKNPDVAELTRGKTGRLYGDLFAVLTTLKGLPMTYNRDLQEDKERVFDAADTVRAALAVFAAMLAEARADEARMAAAAADPLLLATDLADHLVRAGVPFRQAHEITGRLVARAEELKTPLDRLPDAEWPAAHSSLDAAAARKLFSVPRSLAARRAPGAPSPANVRRELAKWQARLGQKTRK